MMVASLRTILLTGGLLLAVLDPASAEPGPHHVSALTAILRRYAYNPASPPLPASEFSRQVWPHRLVNLRQRLEIVGNDGGNGTRGR
jgi:hypothetical protein